MQKHEPIIESSSQSTAPIITYVLLAIVILQGFFNIYLLTGNSVTLPASTGIDALGVKKALLELEYEKVGGKENYDLISKATLIQMHEQIPQIREFVETSGGVVAKPSNNDTSLVLDADRIATILQGAAIEWNPNADIMVIEYTDTECPFCMRQYHDTRLPDTLSSQYGDKVAFVFKNNRGVNHQWTEAKAVGSLCAKKIWGTDAYVKFYKTVMDGSTQGGGVYPVSALPDAAKAAGINIAEWQSCFDKRETVAEYLAETQEAASFGLRGTPGTLILNVKTGKYATIEWAYPYASFVEKIESLMN